MINHRFQTERPGSRISRWVSLSYFCQWNVPRPFIRPPFYIVTCSA